MLNGLLANCGVSTQKISNVIFLCLGVSTNSISNVGDLHFEVVDTASKVHNEIMPFME